MSTATHGRPSSPAAVVICGGASRRMGRPKAWLPFGGELLLQRVVRLVGEAAAPIVVVAAPGQDLPPLPAGVAIVRDPIPGRGPLQGLAAGLAALPVGVDLAYATATDGPFLATGWVARLAELIGDQHAAVPRAGGFLHPLAALYRKSPALAAIEALLRADRLRTTGLIEALRTRIVEPEELADIDPGLRTLCNLNTPEDYARALAEAQSGLIPPSSPC